MYPWLQVQVKLPGLLVQAALVSQLSVLVEHSSISEQCMGLIAYFPLLALRYIPVHTTPLPVYPWLQVQVKLPGLLVQAALVSQLSVLVEHSSISEQCMGLIVYFPLLALRYIPVHTTPLPVYPWLQVQVNLPGLLVQAALVSQLSVLVEHSSISEQCMGLIAYFPLLALRYIPVHTTPLPVYPWLQVQVKLPGLLVQAALVSQLSVLVEHSSISEQCMGLIAYFPLLALRYIPVHITPLPVYPWLQVQVKLPGLLVQAALVSQLSVLVEHSSISEKWMGLIAYFPLLALRYIPVHTTPLPVYPWLQVQVNLPGLLVQAALVSQLSVLVEHSSISEKWMGLIAYFPLLALRYIPVHTTPLPVYPWLQVQVNLPGLLVQAALISQLSVLVEHSSISEKWMGLIAYFPLLALRYIPVHTTPLPVYPWLQVQVKLPGLLVQAALVSQLSVLVEHSSISEQWMGLIAYFPLLALRYIPAHTTPSPVYPWLQVQVKLPGVLVQAALVSQLSVLVEHSSISA